MKHMQDAHPDRFLLPFTDLSLASDQLHFHVGWLRFVQEEEENLSTDLHKHSIDEMQYVLQGELTFLFPEGREITLKEEQYLLIPAYTMHAIRNDRPDSQKLVIGFSLESREEKIVRCLSSRRTIGIASASHTFRLLVQSLQEKERSEQLHASITTRFLVLSLLLDALENIAQSQNHSVENMEMTRLVRNAERMDFVKEYIRKYAFQGGDCQTAAQLLGITPRHLNRLCKESLGASVEELLREERLRQVKLLLETSDYSLMDIAEMARFSNVYSFMRHFKRYTGIAPGEYRKRKTQK